MQRRSRAAMEAAHEAPRAPPRVLPSAAAAKSYSVVRSSRRSLLVDRCTGICMLQVTSRDQAAPDRPCHRAAADDD